MRCSVGQRAPSAASRVFRPSLMAYAASGAVPCDEGEDALYDCFCFRELPRKHMHVVVGTLSVRSSHLPIESAAR